MRKKLTVQIKSLTVSDRKLSLWFAGLLAIMASAYFSYEMGYFLFLVEADKSMLSWLNLLVFLFFYLKLGLKIKQNQTYSEDMDSGYEASEYCMAIGMLGTVTGFIIMTYGMAGVDFSNVENIKQLFAMATGGMSTALFTTAIGLVTSLLLRLSYYMAEER